MSISPPLPASLRLGTKHLTVRAGRRTLRIPVTHLPAGSLAAVRRLVEAREPQVVAAPSLTSDAKALLAKHGWGWIDQAGNVQLERDGVLISVSVPVSRQGPYRQMLVSPQGERVVRHLLDHYPKTFRWVELAQATQLDRGYTTRVLQRLDEAGLVARERGSPVAVPYPAELFELWRLRSARVVESSWACALRPHQIAERAARLSPVGIAFTGVYAAGRLTGVLDADRVEAYVVDLRAARKLANSLEAEPAERGANLVLLVHRDPAVTTIGVRESDRLRFASASQIYKDAVQRGRGRESEAAAAFRRERLRW